MHDVGQGIVRADEGRLDLGVPSERTQARGKVLRRSVLALGPRPAALMGHKRLNLGKRIHGSLDRWRYQIR